MLYQHGNRLNTIRNIKTNDVNIEKKLVHLRKLKSGDMQELPLCDIMIVILKHYLEVRKSLPGDYLFCTYLGNKLSSHGLQSAVKSYNKSRNVNKTSLHLYRHKFAEIFCKSNGNIFKLQILLNHKTLEMTRHYVRLYASDLRKDVNESNPLELINKFEF